MTRGKGWTLFAALMPMTVINLMHVIQRRADLAGTWPAWRQVILDVTLVFAGAVLVAGAAFGVHAWREARRHA